MKLLSKISLFVISIFFMLILFTSCSSKGDFKEITFYLDSEAYEDDKIKLELGSISCSGYTNQYLYVNVAVTNKEYKTKTFSINDAKLIKESTSAKYTVEYVHSLTIEAELTKNITLSSEIPSDIEDDNYKLSFSVDSYDILVYLYETPDELRIDTKDEYDIEFYLYSEPYEDDNIKLGFDRPYFWSIDSQFYLSLILNIYNKEEQEVTYNINNVKYYIKSSLKEYSVDYTKSISINNNDGASMEFAIILEASDTNAKSILSLSVNDYDIVYYLFYKSNN